MSRIITAVAIFVVVIGLAIFETVYTVNISEQVKDELKQAIESYDDDHHNEAKKHIESAEKIWKNHTGLLDTFLIHDNTEEVANEIAVAKNTLKYNSENFPVECEEAVDSLELLIYSMLPFIDNVL